MKRWRTNGHWAAWFYDETYRANIDLLWNVTPKQLDEFLETRHNGERSGRGQDFGGTCCNVFSKSGAQTQVIALREWPRKPDAMDYSFLAHECLHATVNILSERGLPLVPLQSTEAYTFLLESLVRRCLEAMDTRHRLP